MTSLFLSRRLRAFAASLLALVLGVGVLVAVASAPAGAANTAVESLHNHDDNAATPAVRQFTGANRYATSLSIARAYAERANAGAGFVDTLILASGESLADAATAAGLAASRNAPILLTTPDRLPRAAENFIADEFIAEIVIVGGIEAVSQAVEDSVSDIDTVSSVTRVAGADQYSTSAAIATEIATVGEYCDTTQPAAVLVNADVSLADAVAAGPLAYAMQLPILLTASSGLTDQVADYLTDAQIERVVIVGGTGAIPESIVDEAFEAGALDVTRISGESRFDTAIAVRAAMANCEGVRLSSTDFALLNADSLADGISAGPLLGVGLSGEATTPVLFSVADGLPSETSEFLSGLPVRTAAGDFIDVRITAIGGTSTIPEEVVQAAIEAATTSQPLTAEISITSPRGSNPPGGPVPGGLTAVQKIVVSFSGPVNLESDSTSPNFGSSALNPAHYTVNSNPLVFGDEIGVFVRPTPQSYIGNVSGRTIEIFLSRYFLEDGDTISVAANKIRGAGGDRRTVAGTTFTFEPVEDNLRPRVQIFAPEGGHEIRIKVTDDNLDWSTRSDNFAPENVMLDRQRLTDITSDSRIAPARSHYAFTEKAAVSAVSLMFGDELASATEDTLRVTICLFGIADGQTRPTANHENYNTITLCESEPPAGLEKLSEGDVITVAANSFADLAGNVSRTTIARVAANNDKPRVIRATVTEPTSSRAPGEVITGTNAAYTWHDFAGPAGDFSPEFAELGEVIYLQIQAKSEGIAGGSLGNIWAVEWYRLPPDDDLVAEASVTILEKRKIIRIGFDEDATLAAIVDTLLNHEALNENFDVYSDVLKDRELGERIVAATDDPNIDDDGDKVFDPANIFTRNINFEEIGTPLENTLISFNSVGIRSVTVTLTFNDVLKNFNYNNLITANARPVGDVTGEENFPDETFWQDADGGARVPIRLTSEVSFVLSTWFPSEDEPGKPPGLPAPGDIITLPAGIAMNFADATSDAAEIRLRAG